jgi:hypothetical protein
LDVIERKQERLENLNNEELHKFVTFIKYYKRIQVKWHEMGMVCSAYGTDEKCINILTGITGKMIVLGRTKHKMGRNIRWMIRNRV